MFSWSSQAEEVLKVSQFLGRLIRSPGEAEERGVWSSQGGGKDKHLFSSTFLSLGHLKHLFFLFFFFSFFLSLGPELVITQLSLNSVKESEAAQSCLTLCNPMYCSLTGSSVHGIFQARVLECIAISFSRGSSQARDPAWASHIVRRCFTIWATWTLCYCYCC